MTKVALLGCWHVHAIHYALSAQAAGATIVGVWDLDAALAEEASAHLGAPIIDSVDELLSLAEAVIVTAAPADKGPLILATVEHGLPVLTEKPLAPTVELCDAIIAAATQRDTVCRVAMPVLSQGALRAFRQAAADGVVGPPSIARARIVIDGRTRNWLPERFDDPASALWGAVGDLGCHALVLADELMGGRTPAKVRALLAKRPTSKLDDQGVVTLAYADGELVTVESSHCGAAKVSITDAELIGPDGALNLRGGRVELVTEAGPSEIEVGDDVEPVAAWLGELGDGVDVDHLAAMRRLTNLIVGIYDAAEAP